MGSMLVALAAVLALSQQPDRVPVPDAPAQRDAEKFLKTLFKDEYRAKSDPEKIILAQKLYTQAIEIKDNPARQFVALRECHAIAIQAGMWERADKACDAIRERFHAPVAAMRLATLAAKLKTVPDPKLFATEHFELAEAAAEEEDFDTALKAAQAGAAIAKKAKDLGLISRADVVVKDLGERKAKFEPLRKALETLKTKPADPEANLLAGRYLAFQKGDWSGGLPLLEKGSDARLRQLAGWDLGSPARVDDRLAVADGWWDVGEKDAEAQAMLRRRAAHWYALALPDAPEGAKGRLEERLKAAGVNLAAGKPTEGPFELGAQGGIRNWLVLGPFPAAMANPLDVDFLGGESNHSPGAGLAVDDGAGGKPIWRAVAVPGGALDLHVAVGNAGQPQNQVAYVAAWVEVDADLDLVFRVGSDDNNRVWLDGVEIGRALGFHGFAWDQYAYPAKVSKGRRLLLAKIFSRGGGFGVGIRLTTRTLEVPRGIKIWN